MSYIPKSAMKRIVMANNRSAALASAMTAQVILQTPRRMEAGVTPLGIQGMYDVYLDGVKQHLCTLADVDRGYVVRYIRGKSNRPQTKQTETIHGKVEIRRRGEKRKTSAVDDKSTSRQTGNVAQADSGTGAGVPCGPSTVETPEA
jgi:hypothetical protein